MKKTLIALALGLLAFSSPGQAQETPMWIRKNAISPDGSRIAFCYKGDIYVVSADGGRALQITANEAYDSDPIWTKDSRRIVFSSYREGSKDIYMTSAEGGIPVRITDYPGNETPKAVLADGRILFSAAFQADAGYGGFPGGQQLYITDGQGGRPELVTSMPLSEISVAADGTVLYEDYKGYEDPLRKHHTSSVTRDIWVYRGASPQGSFRIDGKGTFTQLSTYKGEDRQPVFAADGDTFYYLSEQDGKALNIYRSSLGNPGQSVQLTFADKNPVRFISVSDDGTLAYSYNGDLYTLRDGGQPRKLDISVVRDETEKDKRKLYPTGATSMAVSPDGKEIAMIIRGDVFVTSTEYRTTKRITNTAEQERNVCFSKDGRELYYSAERDGHWGVWRTILTEKDEKNFTYSTKMKEELFSDPGMTCFQPVVSPDGKWVAYLKDRTDLVIKPSKGGKMKVLVSGVNFSYSDGDQHFAWSPDSHYLLCNYQADGGWNNEDVAVVDIDSGQIINLTRSGYSDGAFRWALGGKAMTWESDKNGYRSHGSWGAESDIYIMFFDGRTMTEFTRDKEDEEIDKMLSGKTDKQLAKEEKKDSTDLEKSKKLKLDFDHRDLRIRRLTKASARYGDHFLSKDGRKLYYVSPLETGSGLCELDIREGSVKVLARGVSGRIIPSEDGQSIYMLSGHGISRITLAGGATKQITFDSGFEFMPRAERTYMFDHIWKQVQEKFYDPDIHGIDWAYYRDNYRRFLPYINNNFDFQDLLSEMLGELNGSHTGARYYAVGGEIPGYLGVLYDNEYRGDGLRIKEVLPDGPISLADDEIAPGDIILSIDGQPVEAGREWRRLLVGKTGRKVALTVRKGKKETEIFVQPIASESALLYRRWVRQREEMVERLSGGRVGYVHVQGMDSPSFREVYSKALGKYRNCEALIVDTRHNGGGWLHDDLVTLLGGKEYIHFTPRGHFASKEPFTKWTRPSCVLVCEDNYSDASGFPYAYRALGLGKLIGTPVPGTMTAVWWENQIDNSIIFGIPQVGSFGLAEQRYLENMQLEPDILVYNDPASVLNGEDKQLEAAVREMLSQID